LNSQPTAISMTERGDPYENALAERMNGIIKGDLIFTQAWKVLKKPTSAL
jgi:putative transposase